MLSLDGHNHIEIPERYPINRFYASAVDSFCSAQHSFNSFLSKKDSLLSYKDLTEFNWLFGILNFMNFHLKGCR